VPRTKRRPDDLLLFEMRYSIIYFIIYERFEFYFEEIATRYATASCFTLRYLDMNCSFWLWPNEK
jgi:hypothetical protein